MKILDEFWDFLNYLVNRNIQVRQFELPIILGALPFPIPSIRDTVWQLDSIWTGGTDLNKALWFSEVALMSMTDRPELVPLINSS